MRSDISTIGLGASAAPLKQPSKNRNSSVNSSSSKGRIMDGFFSRGTSPTGGVKNIAAKAKDGVTPIISSSAKTVHRSAQRSKTLMRSAVSRPTPASSKDSTAIKTANKVQAQKVSEQRSFRAKNTAKNAKVKRFSPFSPKTVTHAVAATTPTRASAKTAAATSHQVMPSMVTSASHHHLERLLDEALHRADAHKKALQGKLPGRSWWQKIFDAPKWLSIGSVVLAVTILCGFFAWQNVPQVSMRIAASKSNVNASVPGYTPPGFSFAGPIKYTDSSVSMGFRANSDASRNFTITQESSNETSSSLAANNLAEDSSVQTSEVNGTTVYIYGNANHATWVNHGVRYTIQDDAKLDTEQILKIAGSLQ